MLVLGWPFTPSQGLQYAKTRKFTVGTSRGFRDGIWGQCAEDIEKQTGLGCYRCWVDDKVTKVFGISCIRRPRNAETIVEKIKEDLQPELLKTFQKMMFADSGPKWYRYDDGLSEAGYVFVADDDEEEDFVIPEPPILYESAETEGATSSGRAVSSSGISISLNQNSRYRVQLTDFGNKEMKGTTNAHPEESLGA
ncbi:hypothetical protein QCA50_008413 [Cerrena zonata]|uniref:Uncharacterized protein n=1 Tax=Cerrena zonata TaxID=2478898 RepID=A0AAW0G2V6_9APHY